jgi:S-DNA-T family DNA segregation ATPase FtsK/SpoIIIE
MTARTRSRPRTGRTTRRRKRTWRFERYLKAEIIGAAVALLVLLAIVIAINPGTVASDTRDWFLRHFGLGIAVVLGFAAWLGIAIWRGRHTDRQRFARHLGGAAALALFVWGAFALNHAHWQVGSVDFHHVTLGGTFGHAMFGGFLRVVAWLCLLILSVVLLAPGFARWCAVNIPRGIEIAWERRWPHRAAATMGNWMRAAFQRPETTDERANGVIGGEGPSLHHAVALEDAPVIYRPQIDAASPASTLGAGAAFAFGGSTAEPAMEQPRETAPEEERDADEPGEPHQLGLSLDGKPGWQLPAIEMLNAPQPSTSRTHDNAARAQLIVDTLASFGVDAAVVEINEGPTVTQFGVEPGWEVRYKEVPLRDTNGKQLMNPDGRPRVERVETGRTRVRVNKITALQNDLALALAAPSLRIEAPVPGRAIVGIEVPNDSATVVTMRSVMETKEFEQLARKSRLAMALGKGVSGTPIVADLAKMPHLLIAGATGSGKSVCMNAIIAGIMMNATPDQVRFVMIDPKRVELAAYADIPHMAFSEVIVDVDKVVGTLQAVVGEMEARYKKFQDVGVRNLDAYNKHPRILKKLPYWVVIIDELADLMMAAPFEVEKLIARLAQLARATGIHLIVATQRPSVDVVTGLIKANFPTRIAFAVTSQVDSRTILDMVGAEKLLGRGDMLYLPTDAAKPVRIQGVYVSDAEVERLVEFWKDDRFRELAPEMSDDLLEQALIEQNGGEDFAVGFDDPLLEQARELARHHKHVSPSLLQRRLNIGYVKAAKLIDMLEDEGIVGPRIDGESREVLAPPAESILD